MTAADHKIIIEKNADFSIDVQLFDDVNPKDVTGYTVQMRLKHSVTQLDIDSGGVYSLLSIGDIYSVDIGIGSLIPDEGSDPVTYYNGYVNVLIDKDVTDVLATRNSIEISPFATEYNYFYTIDVNDVTSGEDIRVLRGKCSVRE